MLYLRLSFYLCTRISFIWLASSIKSFISFNDESTPLGAVVHCRRCWSCLLLPRSLVLGPWSRVLALVNYQNGLRGKWSKGGIIEYAAKCKWAKYHTELQNRGLGLQMSWSSWSEAGLLLLRATPCCRAEGFCWIKLNAGPLPPCVHCYLWLKAQGLADGRPPLRPHIYLHAIHLLSEARFCMLNITLHVSIHVHHLITPPTLLVFFFVPDSLLGSRRIDWKLWEKNISLFILDYSITLILFSTEAFFQMEAF